MTSKATNLYRELAYRAGDGVEIVLFWHEFTDELNVAETRFEDWLSRSTAQHQRTLSMKGT